MPGVEEIHVELSWDSRRTPELASGSAKIIFRFG
jgi:hypothetical protein